MCDLCGQTGRYYLGEGDSAPCMFCEEETREVSPILALLYEPHETQTVAAYRMKHDVENVLGTYVSTKLLIQAGVFRGLVEKRDKKSFYVKERFPMEWLWDNVKTRPKGTRQVHWDAYQRVVARIESDCESRQASSLAHQTQRPPSSRNTMK